MKQEIPLTPGKSIEYRRFPGGPEYLVTLSGFGRGANQFAELRRAIRTDYTVISLTLPFHGGYWTEERFRPEDIAEAVLRMVPKKSTLHLLGHSLGARVWLKTFPLLEREISSLTLAAPDGLSGRYTSWIDQLPAFIIETLAKLLDRPNGILRLADFLRRHQLIDAFQQRYLQQQLSDPFHQQRLAGTLRSLVHFKIGTKELQAIDRAKTVTVLMGQSDGLLRQEKIRTAFARSARVDVIETPGGHGLPTNKLAELYRSIL